MEKNNKKLVSQNVTKKGDNFLVVTEQTQFEVDIAQLTQDEKRLRIRRDQLLVELNKADAELIEISNLKSYLKSS